MNAIKNLCVLKIATVVCCMMFILVGCTSDNEQVSPAYHAEHLIRFTDNPNFVEGESEVITTDSSEQTIELKIMSIIDPKITSISNLSYVACEWNEEWQDWYPSDNPHNEIQSCSFYSTTYENVDGVPVIKIKLSANDSKKERRAFLAPGAVGDFHDYIIPYGMVEIVQKY